MFVIVSTALTEEGWDHRWSKAASMEWRRGIEGDYSGKYNAWALQRNRGDWEQREGGGEREIEKRKSGWSGCRYCTYYLLTHQADGSVHWHLCSWLDVADRTSTTDNNEARRVFGFQSIQEWIWYLVWRGGSSMILNKLIKNRL